MLVRQLVDTLDKDLVLELYGYGSDDKLEHQGTFSLGSAASLELLLSQYGEEAVRHHDVYKAYAMVYLEG